MTLLHEQFISETGNSIFYTFENCDGGYQNIVFSVEYVSWLEGKITSDNSENTPSPCSASICVHNSRGRCYNGHIPKICPL